MNPTSLTEPPAATDSTVVSPRFWRQLQLLTYTLLLFALFIFILEKFRPILQPLFVAVFIAYLIRPLHQVLVDRGVPSVLAYCLMVFLILTVLFGFGRVLYRSFEQIMERLPLYEAKIDKLLQGVATTLDLEDADKMSVRDLGVWSDPASAMDALRTAVGTFTNFFAGLAVTFVYLIFLIAEQFSLKQRLARGFGERHAGNVLRIAETV